MASNALATTDGNKGRAAEIEVSHQQKVLDTPRTREACRKLGFVLEDLNYKGLDDFSIPGDKRELQQLRYDHAEKKRRERLGQVLAERAKVIEANKKKGEVPGVQSGQFLAMLESLFEKEAKRLEIDLKSQLRQHSSLVNANEEQLRKEENMQKLLEQRELKKKDIDVQKKKDAAMTKEKHAEREQRSQAIQEAQKKEFEEKKAAQARLIVAEEERLLRFKEEQAALSSEKSAHWREKCHKMKEKWIVAQEEKRVLGEQKLVELEKKIEAVHKRREDEQNARVYRSEEQHLHLMDVRDQKDRLDRVDSYRRGELKEQIEGNVERIETLLALKDQLLEQRKARTLKAEATRGSRGLNLGRDVAPGPGHYDMKSMLLENPAPKMAQSKIGHSEFIDSITRRTAANPAPGAYSVDKLRNGDTVSGSGQNGGKFGNGSRVSFLEDACKAKADVPAPGIYKMPSTMDNRTTKMRRDKVTHPNLDKTSAKNYPTWARPGTDTPGPAGYSVDDYARKETMRRAQRSLPSLTRDMLRPQKVASN
eukprot:TRINITY_DN81854_c0_g1_i1.p1 TRINITY_DN81854_c0_g1~~TRINITY_DN81854_c0_g1_i1.p1  ORF type:complete len:536 (-),score=190.05 TRINITY_DN81854_c0_g1_i1:112-1719(-)